MQILLIGSGGREHALALALLLDPAVNQLTCAPGNAGIADICDVRAVDVGDPAAIVTLAVELGVDLVVIGPERPLVAGVADALAAAHVPCFGPTSAAAALEGSKTFAKDVMLSAGIPTARALSCSSIDQVVNALDEFGAPYVVKDDGLAAGKGVVVTEERPVALAHAETCLAAGSVVVIEEFLDGPEVSLFCICDGATVVPLIPAQDFKRFGDGDSGPNTGGMGAYAPLDWVPQSLVADVVRDVALPAVAQMAHRGTPYSGVLYVGLALTSRGPRVIEFNARFGDPETQSVLALLQTPLAGLLLAAANGTLAEHPALQWRSGYAVTVVLAAAGYPSKPRTGDVIGLPAAQPADVLILHAGTAVRDSDVISSGGRVLGVVGVGPSLADARTKAYGAIEQITLFGSHYRTDIAANP